VNIYEARRLVAERLNKSAEKGRAEAEVKEIERGARLSPATAAGDRRKLRGLPAVARGVSGHVPGTDPLEALLAKEDRCPATEAGDPCMLEPGHVGHHRWAPFG
jgi:hypothetical protein